LRNNTLNREAFSVARFINTGELTREEIIDTLSAAAADAGLESDEIARAIESGIDARLRLS